MGERAAAGVHGPALPVAIVRPSLMAGIAHGPAAGYVGNPAGPTAVALAYGTGGACAVFARLDPQRASHAHRHSLAHITH